MWLNGDTGRATLNFALNIEKLAWFCSSEKEEFNVHGDLVINEFCSSHKEKIKRNVKWILRSPYISFVDSSCAMLQGHLWTSVDNCSPMIRDRIPWVISFDLLLNNFEKNFVLQLIVRVNIPVYLWYFPFSILWDWMQISTTSELEGGNPVVWKRACAFVM